MPYIDTHCHLDFELFDADRRAILARCRELDVRRFILPGVLRDGWSRLVEVGSRFPETAIAPGLHPCFVEQHRPQHLDELRTLIEAQREMTVALGEIGLDYFDRDADRKTQMGYFEEQIAIAEAAALPVMLHVRKAHDDVLQRLRNSNVRQGGIVHCYSGSLQQAEKYLELGFRLGIGGVITYDNARRLQSIVRSLPLDAFVLETDAPDIPPASRRGEPHTPESIPEIGDAFSRYRDEDPEVVVAALYRNTVSLFPGLED